MKTSQDLGERLKRARRDADHESVDAAVAAGCPVPLGTLKRWETGGVDPGILAVAELATFYGCSLEWLAGRVDHPSGLPVGRVLVDQDAVDAVLAGRAARQTTYVAAEIPQRPRVVTASEWAELKQRLDSAAKKFP